MVPLFSKADLNKFQHDIQNEVTLICAKFGKDLFSISKVIGRETKWPRFFDLPCMHSKMFILSAVQVLHFSRQIISLRNYSPLRYGWDFQELKIIVRDSRKVYRYA